MLVNTKGPIHEAVKNNNLEELREIIARGDSIDAVDENKRTALYYACINEDCFILFKLTKI